MQGIRDWHRLAILLQLNPQEIKLFAHWIPRCRGLQSPVRRPCPRPAAPTGPGRAGYGVLKGGCDQWVWMILGWLFTTLGRFFGWFSGWFLNDIMISDDFRMNWCFFDNVPDWADFLIMMWNTNGFVKLWSKPPKSADGSRLKVHGTAPRFWRMPE